MAAQNTPYIADILPGLKDIRPPEETGTTFEENSALKALYYSTFTSELVLADDSGLDVEALGGAPGVYSARYAGLNASDEENNQLLLNNLKSITNRKARFVAVVTLAKRNQLIASARGEVGGEILYQPEGSGGFGYDPVFFYPPFNQSFGEIDPEQKLSVSHRGRALAAAFQILR